MTTHDDNVSPLFPEGEPSPAMEKWGQRLGPYLDERSAIENIRHRPQPDWPWPPRENPMLGYLVDRAREIAEAEGRDASIVWLAVHAWFEGTVEERYQAYRHLFDPRD